MACGVLATGNSRRVTALTPLSVACADSSTAASSSNGVVYSSSVVGSGIGGREPFEQRQPVGRLHEAPSACARAQDPGEPTRPLGRGASARSGSRLVRVRRRTAWLLAQPLQARLMIATPGAASAADHVLFAAAHRDAVDGAGRQAEVAAGASVREHMVLVPGCADDRVYRTGAGCTWCSRCSGCIVDAPRRRAPVPGPQAGSSGTSGICEQLRPARNRVAGRPEGSG